VPRRTKIERKTKGKIGREEEVGKTGETRKKRRKTVCVAIRPGLFDLCFYTLK